MKRRDPKAKPTMGKAVYYLSEENIENIRKAAEKEDRSMSNWLNRHLADYFENNPA